MKNLFFALAFMLMGTFAFANNNIETEKISIETKTSVPQQSLEAIKTVTVKEDWCADVYVDTETGEIVLVVMYPC